MRIDANTQRMNANDELVYPELSYKLMGVLFRVQNELGSSYQEKYYQRAIEEELRASNIKFEREKMVPLIFRGVSIGRYFLDFLIEDKIALEIKTIEFFRKAEWKQVRGYLKSINLKLGILVNFNSDKLTYKRILNSEFISVN